MNFFRKNVKVSARLGPVTGITKDSRFVRRIKPLYTLTEKETTSYAYLKGFMDKFSECPYSSDAYRNQVRNMLNDFEVKYPGTKHSVITSFLEIMPILKDHYKFTTDGIKSCKICDEPCSQDTCKACQYAETIIKTNQLSS